jgi:hypothetical protein
LTLKVANMAPSDVCRTPAARRRQHHALGVLL